MAKRINESHDFGLVAKAINLPNPTSSQDAATKAYVDSMVIGLTFIENPVRVASVAPISISSPPTQIDGVTLATGDRILLAEQTNRVQNGIWVFQGVGSALVRSGDEYVTGTVVFSGPDGAQNGLIGWIVTTDGQIFTDTTAITFVGAFRNIQAGTGLLQQGNVILLDTPVSVAHGGTGSTTATGAAHNLGVPTVYESDFPGPLPPSSGPVNSPPYTFAVASIVEFPMVQVVNHSTGQVEDVAVAITPGSYSNGVYSGTTVSIDSENWDANKPSRAAYRVTIIG